MKQVIKHLTTGIKLDGKPGTWRVSGYKVYADGVLYLLESETHGEEAPNIIVNARGIVLKDEALNGFNELPF